MDRNPMKESSTGPTFEQLYRPVTRSVMHLIGEAWMREEYLHEPSHPRNQNKGIDHQWFLQD